MKDTYPKYALFTGGVVLMVLLLIKLFNLSYPVEVSNTSKPSELSVVGEGKVDVTPDTAYVDVGVTVNNAKTVDDAQNQINNANNKIIESMEKLKITKANIKTSNYSVYPNYDYDNGQNRISGYNGNVTISIKLSDTQLTSSVISEATKAGANQVQGVRFAIENPDRYREQARNEAIKNAKEQASRLSKELGIGLGSIVNIVESSPTNIRPLYDTASMKAGMGGRVENAAIETGSQTISSTVTLYFEKR